MQSGDEWVEATSLILYPSSEHKDVDGTDCPVITVAAKAPTCKEAGTKAVTYCSGCMLIFSIDGKDTYTATEEGVEVQKPLTEKNYHYGTDKTKYELAINPANHTDLQEVEGVEATCETTGVLHHWYCSGCDKYFTDACCRCPATITIMRTQPTSGQATTAPALQRWSARTTANTC